MQVFFEIPWHLKMNQTLEQLKTDFCYHGIRVRLVCLAFGGIVYFEMIVQFRLRLKL